MKDDRLYLHHMRERCHRITRFVAPGREAFMASDELQAVLEQFLAGESPGSAPDK